MQYFIDFEATQFSERIISIGCIAANGETFKTLVKPVTKKDKVNNFITQLTGITNEMLESAPTANEAFNAFFDFVLENKDDCAPEYFCYGTADKQFIERTVSHMTDTRAVTFARSLQHLLQDYSVNVKTHFQVNTEIALRKAYMLIQNEEIEQHHDALEDARMLYAVARNLKACSPKEAVKLASMKKVEKPVPGGSLRRAPNKFIEWPADKWSADTGADENNWAIKCFVGPHTKYFDSKETAMLWILRYLSKSLSVKKTEHQNIVYNRLEEGFAGKKQPWGFSWVENKERID
jgi:DNA polymerase III epsilon subunit-like protein